MRTYPTPGLGNRNVRPAAIRQGRRGCIYRVTGVTSLANIPAKMYPYLADLHISAGQIQPPISCNRHPCRTHIIRIIQAVLDFFSTTDVGRLVLAEEDAGSGVPAWERREREEGRIVEAE